MTTLTSRAALVAALTALAAPAVAAAAPTHTEIDVRTGDGASVTARSTAAPSMFLSIRRGEDNTLLQAVPMTACGGGMKCATVPSTLRVDDRATIDVGATPAVATMRAIVVHEGTPRINRVSCNPSTPHIGGLMGWEKHWQTFASGIVGGADATTTVTPVAPFKPSTFTGVLPAVIAPGTPVFARQSYTYDAGGESGRISIEHRASSCLGDEIGDPIIDPPVLPQSPPPPPPPPADTVAPTGSLKVGKVLPRLGALRTRGLVSTVTLNEPAVVTQTLRHGRVLVGNGTSTSSTAGPIRVTVKLTKAGKARLRSRRSARLALATSVRDAAGNVRTLTTRSLVIRR